MVDCFVHDFLALFAVQRSWHAVDFGSESSATATSALNGGMLYHGWKDMGWKPV